MWDLQGFLFAVSLAYLCSGVLAVEFTDLRKELLVWHNSCFRLLGALTMIMKSLGIKPASTYLSNGEHKIDIAKLHDRYFQFGETCLQPFAATHRSTGQKAANSRYSPSPQST